MLRAKRETVRVGPPHAWVEAEQDLQYGTRWVARGTRLERDDPLVVAHPEVFLVKYRLSQEVTDA